MVMACHMLRPSTPSLSCGGLLHVQHNPSAHLGSPARPARPPRPPRPQIHRQFRKPLVVFSPKNLLRHPLAKSPLTDFDDKPDDKGIIVSARCACCAHA